MEANTTKTVNINFFDQMRESGFDRLAGQRNIEPNSCGGELLEDIKAYGIIKPLVVWKEEDGELTLGNGNHRLACAREIGITELPVVIYEQIDSYGS